MDAFKRALIFLAGALYGACWILVTVVGRDRLGMDLFGTAGGIIAIMSLIGITLTVSYLSDHWNDNHEK